MTESNIIPPEQLTLTAERTTSTGHRLMHYDGACSHLHGHNMRWEAEVSFGVPDGEDNMTADLKDIAAVIDRYDHALVLNEDDPYVDALLDAGHDPDAIITTEGDPTCEHVARDLRDTLLDELDDAMWASVEVHETDKYGIRTEPASGEREDWD